MFVWVILLAVGLIWPAAPRAQTVSPPLVLEAKVPLGQVSCRIDHLGIDVTRQRLLVAELGNNSLGVVDLTAGKVLHRIRYEPAAGRWICPIYGQQIAGDKGLSIVAQ